MRIVLIGQQAFGKAALEAFMARGDVIAAVFCAPETGRPDPLRLAAEAAGVPVFMFPKLSAPEAMAAMRDAQADLGVMAYVTQFVSQPFCKLPRLGTIQFHPSLLPLHRGAASLNWAVILGRTETGFSIFRPTDGLDEGPVILQHRIPIGRSETLGALYFDKVLPQGVAGLVEAAALVEAGQAVETTQIEDDAGYEGMVGEAESRITWANHVDVTFNLIRGCNPSPGAWTMVGLDKLVVFECEKRPARTFAAVKGKRAGEVVAMEGGSAVIHGQGGFIVAHRVRLGRGGKVTAAEAGLLSGAMLGA